MRKLLLVCVLIHGTSSWSMAGQNRYADKLDLSRDQIVHRVIVPSIEQPQGEVQLVRRGDLLVVRTLLASRVLKRVVAVIDGKERRNWPETSDAYGASIRYREELFRATEQAWEMFRQRSDRSESRQFLVIEFILGSNRGWIALSLPQLEGDLGSLSMIAGQLIQAWKAPVGYVAGNIHEIVKDSFQVDEKAAAELLKPLWPGTGTPAKRPLD